MMWLRGRAGSRTLVTSRPGRIYPTEMKPLVQLDEVRWTSLQHAYGSAKDVPEQLRALRSDDAELRACAWSDLHGSLIRSSDASVRGFPNIGEGHDMSAGSGLLEIYQAIATGVGVYAELASSSDGDIRASVAYLLAWLTPHASTSAAALTRLCEDPVPTVRASAWLALSHATKFDPSLRAASIVRMKAAWPTVRDPLERRALALALVRTEDAEASVEVRPHLREGLENGLQPVIPDRVFPWRRIDTAPFVFCTTFIGTPPSDRREVITAGVHGLRHVHDEHDAADLAYWLLQVGAPKPDGNLGDLASELMLAIANNPKCWHFTDASALLRELSLPNEPDAIRQWVGERT